MNIIIKNARLTNCKPQKLSDKELYQRCKLYDLNARLWLRQFATLLPEVYARRLYKRHNCGSIHEFAYKLAGMNLKTVNKILYLHEKLKDKPALLELFESGAEGWSKLEVVAFIATPETDELWAEKTKHLSQQALIVYVQNFRESEKHRSTNANQMSIDNSRSGESTVNGKTQSVDFNNLKEKNITRFNYEFEHYDPNREDQTIISNTEIEAFSGDVNKIALQHDISPYTRIHQNYTFKLSDEMIFKLRLIKQKLEKKQKETLSWNEVFQLWNFEDL